MALAFLTSSNSSMTCLANFISLKSIIILNNLTTIEWIQWLLEELSWEKLEFSSFCSNLKDCLWPQILADKSKSKLLNPTDLDFVVNLFFELYFFSSYSYSSIKSILSGSIFSTAA